MFELLQVAEAFFENRFGFENFTPGWDLSVTILSLGAAGLAILCEMDKRHSVMRRTVRRARMGQSVARRRHLARAATMRPVRAAHGPSAT